MALLFRAAFSFFAALRISELVPSNKKGLSGLLFNTIKADYRCIKIFLHRFKTDQLGKGSWINLYVCIDQVICPVRLLNAYISVRPIGQHLLFVRENNSPLTNFQFTRVFSKCLQFLQKDSLLLSCHSFQIGAETETAKIGLDKDRIKRIGRWKFNAYALYVRPN